MQLELLEASAIQVNAVLGSIRYYLTTVALRRQMMMANYLEEENILFLAGEGEY